LADVDPALDERMKNAHLYIAVSQDADLNGGFNSQITFG